MYPADREPSRVAAADIDDDGDADLLVANGRGEGLSVLLNNGTGSFATPVNYNVGGATLLTIADVDGDGDEDVVTADVGAGNELTVLLNDGSGNFGSPANYFIDVGGLSDIHDIVVANFDGDNHIDLAVLYYAPAGIAGVMLMKNNGDGTFPPDYLCPHYAVHGGAQSGCATDLNGDHRFDLVVSSLFENRIAVLRGNAEGTLDSAIYYSTSGYCGQVVAADFDADGDNDIVVGGESVTLFRNQGTGTLDIPVYFAAANAALCAALIDEDTSVDLAIIGRSSTCYGGSCGVSFARNDGSGAFSFSAPYGADAVPRSILAVDLDGDSDKDLVLANSMRGADDVTVLLNTGGGTFQSAADYPFSQTPSALRVVDVNADGDLDLVIGSFTVDSVTVSENDGHGSFGSPRRFASYICRSLSAADLDRDGDVDIALVNYTSGKVHIMKNNGTGTFTLSGEYVAGSYVTAVESGDFDGDGDMDLAITNEDYQGYISVLFNTGDGSFLAPVSYPAGRYPTGPAIVDWDRDGDLDIVFGYRVFLPTQHGSVGILQNDGHGNFVWADDFYLYRFPQSVVAGDFNVDGRMDIAVADPHRIGFLTVNYVSVLLMNGDETYDVHEYLAGDRRGHRLMGVDLNQDGYLDLAVANDSSASTTVLVNDKHGNFGQIATYAVGSYPSSIGSGDIDEDGDEDLVVSNGVGGTVTVLLNCTDVVTGVEDGPDSEREVCQIMIRNDPNPFNGGTVITYNLDRWEHINLKVFNLLGQEVVSLMDRDQGPGLHSVEWDGRDGRGRAGTSGVYFCRLRVGDRVLTRKMTLLR